MEGYRDELLEQAIAMEQLSDEFEQYRVKAESDINKIAKAYQEYQNVHSDEAFNEMQDAMHRAIADKELQADSYNKLIKQLEETKKLLEEEKNRDKDSEKDNIIDLLESELDNLLKENKKVEQEAEDHRQALLARDDLNKKLYKQAQDLDKKVKESSNKEKKLSDEKKTLEQKVKTLDSEKKNLEQKVKSLETKKKTVDLKPYKDKEAQQQKQIISLEADKKKLEKENKELTDFKNKAKDMVPKADLDKAKKDMSEAEKKRDDYKNKINELEDKIITMQKEKDANQAVDITNKDMMKQLDEDNEKLKKNNTTLEDSNKALRKQVLSLESSLKQALESNTESEITKVTLNKLANEKKQIQNQLNEANGKLLATNSQLKKVATDALRTKDLLKVKEKENEALKNKCKNDVKIQQLSNLMETCQQDKLEALAKKDKENEVTKKKLEDCKKELAKLESASKLSQSKLDEERTKLKLTEKRYNEMMSNVPSKEKFDQIEKERDDELIARKRCELELQKLKDMIKKLERELKICLESSKREKEELQKKIKKVEEEKKNINNEKKDINKKATELKKKEEEQKKQDNQLAKQQNIIRKEQEHMNQNKKVLQDKEEKLKQVQNKLQKAIKEGASTKTLEDLEEAVRSKQQEINEKNKRIQKDIDANILRTFQKPTIPKASLKSREEKRVEQRKEEREKNLNKKRGETAFNRITESSNKKLKDAREKLKKKGLTGKKLDQAFDKASLVIKKEAMQQADKLNTNNKIIDLTKVDKTIEHQINENKDDDIEMNVMHIKKEKPKREVRREPQPRIRIPTPVLDTIPDENPQEELPLGQYRLEEAPIDLTGEPAPSSQRGLSTEYDVSDLNAPNLPNLEEDEDGDEEMGLGIYTKLKLIEKGRGVNKNRWISKKIKKLMEEGKPQNQAIAIAYAMYNSKNKKKKVKTHKKQKKTVKFADLIKKR